MNLMYNMYSGKHDTIVHSNRIILLSLPSGCCIDAYLSRRLKNKPGKKTNSFFTVDVCTETRLSHRFGSFIYLGAGFFDTKDYVLQNHN